MVLELVTAVSLLVAGVVTVVARNRDADHLAKIDRLELELAAADEEITRLNAAQAEYDDAVLEYMDREKRFKEIQAEIARQLALQADKPDTDGLGD